MSQEGSSPPSKGKGRAVPEDDMSRLNIEQNGEASSAPAEESADEEVETGAASSDPNATKKTSKKKQLKQALSTLSSSTASSSTPASSTDRLPAQAIDSMSFEQLQALLRSNPALQSSMSPTSAADQRALRDQLKQMSAADLATGLGRGKNAKDMASYKFWSTQPVPRFDDAAPGSKPTPEASAGSSSSSAKDDSASGPATKEKKPFKEGQIQVIEQDKVPNIPQKLHDSFVWSEVDIEKEAELEEVRNLLSHHYVEDTEAMFRFNYAFETLRWALKAPGWRKSWHVGVRAANSGRLVAFISAVPVKLRVNNAQLKPYSAEVNFLCVHKKLRAKRLAPVLIGEITRRCYAVGVFQAVYTAGIVLPKPVASCRYFHRSLNWEKLYNVGFSPLPAASTIKRQIAKFKLPDVTATPGLRAMEARDADAVTSLLGRYLKQVDLAQEFNKEEVLHWLLDKETDLKSPKRVVWTYVVEGPKGKITDFFSFYCLESTVIKATGNVVVRAAYLFYYATEAAFQPKQSKKEGGKAEILGKRLNELVHDALILAKQANFDVFNALTLLDNPLFLHKQLFGAGDGQLHYYLFNYRTKDIPAGVDDKGEVDESKRGGVGVIML